MNQYEDWGEPAIREVAGSIRRLAAIYVLLCCAVMYVFWYVAIERRARRVLRPKE